MKKELKPTPALAFVCKVCMRSFYTHLPESAKQFKCKSCREKEAERFLLANE